MNKRQIRKLAKMTAGQILEREVIFNDLVNSTAESKGLSETESEILQDEFDTLIDKLKSQSITE